MNLDNIFIAITDHALQRFRERIDPCAKRMDIVDYIREGSNIENGRDLIVYHKHMEFRLQRSGAKSFRLITVVFNEIK